MVNPLADLIAILDLDDLDASTYEDIFVGQCQPVPHGRVFGGQVLAQSIIAANRTIPDGRMIHSMHAYFLRPGDVNESITFSVNRLHDGRSFSTRRTQAFQHGKPILSMIASFQSADTGFDHQITAPTGLPDPNTLPDPVDQLRGIDHPRARYWVDSRPFEIRYLTEPLYLRPAQERIQEQTVWFKAKGALPDNPALHRAALAYAVDYVTLEPILRKHGIPWIDPGLKSASLDHAMWFHRSFRADDWLLYQQQSPSATSGRGLATGYIFSKDGTLVATVAQEGMVRHSGL